MSDDSRCRRCQGEFDEGRYLVQLDSDPAFEPLMKMTICEHCRKSFLGWVARQRKSSRSDRSSSTSSSSSSGSSSRSERSIKPELIEQEAPSFKAMVETARSGFNTLVDASRTASARPSGSPYLENDITQNSVDTNEIRLDTPANYLMTLGVVVAIFVGISILLLYVLNA